TLYQMVTGELPFRSMGPLDAWMKKINNELTPPSQIVPDLSERINWAILRAMSADPEKRPDSCREFVEDLTGYSTRKVPVPATAANVRLPTPRPPSSGQHRAIPHIPLEPTRGRSDWYIWVFLLALAMAFGIAATLIFK